MVQIFADCYNVGSSNRMNDASDLTEQLPMHYAKAAFGEAACCSVTHSGTTPIDVVRTQMQLEPAKYTSFISADKNIISAEGSGALSTGVMPTSQGYFVQGWFKFGGVEICKTRFAMGMSEQDARENRDFNTLGGSAVAEFVADVFLCPYEACRTRSVSDPSYANGMLATGQKLVTANGVVKGLYSDFGLNVVQADFVQPWQSITYNRRWWRPSTRILALPRLKRAKLRC